MQIDIFEGYAVYGIRDNSAQESHGAGEAVPPQAYAQAGGAAL